MKIKAQAKSKKRLSRVGRDVLAGLEEYAAYQRGEKTGAKLYTFTAAPADVSPAGKSFRG